MSAVLYTNHIDGVLTSGVSSSAGSVVSAVFGVLPVVSGTDYLWIVIDPDASAGTPEIVKVTAHASASTTVTVSRGQQASVARAHLANVRVTSPVTKADLDSFLTGAGDLVDGSVATAKLADSAITTSKIADDAVTQAKVADDAVGMAQLASDVFTYSSGDIKQSIRDVAEAGWLLLNGAAIASASSLYPSLWAVAPASWKSGATLTLPDMDDKITQGPASGSSAGIGSTNGSNTVTLSTAHLPAHSHAVNNHDHTINHDHGSVNTDNDSHTHTMDHDHPAANTNTSGSHGHTGIESGYSGADYGQDGTFATGTTKTGLSLGSSFPAINIGNTGSLHNHQFVTPAHTGTTQTKTHNHSVDLPNFTGSSGTKTGLTTGNTGSGTAHSIEQSSLRVNFFIKT